MPQPQGDQTVFTSFQPIAQLRRNDAGTTLLLLSTFTQYTEPIDDPWFWAHQKTSVTAIDGTGKPILMEAYIPDNPSVLGCSEQLRWCNQATKDRCTPFFGGHISDMGDPLIRALDLNGRQIEILKRLQQASDLSLLPIVVQFTGAETLLASDYYEGLSQALPSNQWELEANNWLATAIATMQLNTLQYVLGDGSSQEQVKPTPTAEWMCSNQIVRRSDFSSFSVFGMCMILVVGGMIITLDLCSEAIFTRQSNLIRGPRMRDWVSQGLLQTQRRLFEFRNLGGKWSGKYDAIPRTEVDEKFSTAVAFEEGPTSVEQAGKEMSTVSEDVEDSCRHRNSSVRSEQPFLPRMNLDGKD